MRNVINKHGRMGMMGVLMLFGAAQAMTLKGTVTGPDGAPVDGAAVSVYWAALNVEQPGFEIRLVADAATCSSGLFSVEVDGDLRSSETGWLFFAQKSGLSIGFSMLQSTPDNTTSIQLTAPHTLAGRIEDTHGNALAEAEVRLLIVAVPGGQENYTLGFEPIRHFVTQTDSQGRFEFTQLPKDCTAEIMIKKPGMATFHSLTSNIDPEQGLTFAVGQEDIVLTLSEAVRISGIITDGNDEPVGSVRVVALDAGHGHIAILTPTLAQAEADGTFTLNDLAPGTYTLSVVDPDWVAEPVTVDVRTEVGVPLKVSKGVLLTVTVMDGISNQPVPAAQVNISSQDEHTSITQGSASTDHEGKLQRRVLPGTYHLHAYAPGYQSTRSVAAVVEDGEPSEVTITLGATARITGTVTDADGKPVPQADVFVLPVSGNLRDAIRKTDDNGQFTLGWEPERITWVQGEFYIAAIDKENNRAVIEPIDEQTTDIRLTLQPGLTITGKVTDSQGSPLAGANVNVQFRGSNWSSTLQGYTANTDQDGLYRIAAIPAEQRYSLSITGPKGYGTGSQALELSQDSLETSVPDTALQLANLSVAGKVVDEDGNPLEGVQLHCYGTGQPSAQARTGADGTFVFDAVCEGDLSIQANYHQDGAYMYSSVRTEGGAQEVTIVLSPQSSGGRFVPRQPAALVGKPLPDLSSYGLELSTEAGPTLVCVWEWRQRPSRHMVRELAAMEDTLSSRSVQVVLLNGESTDLQPLEAWLSDFDIPFACGVISIDPDNARFNLGVRAMPWLILTDAERSVIAEGFDLSQLTEKLDGLK